MSEIARSISTSFSDSDSETEEEISKINTKFVDFENVSDDETADSENEATSECSENESISIEEEQEISDFDSDEEEFIDVDNRTFFVGSSRGSAEKSPESSANKASKKAVGIPYLRKSLFENGDSVFAFFEEDDKYPTDSNISSIPKNLHSHLKWKICNFTPKVVRVALRRGGFKLVRDGKNWIASWGKHFSAEKFKNIQYWQKVNHFPMSFELGRKDRLSLNISRMQERTQDKGFNFLPETYILPHARRKLKGNFNKYKIWIVKPPANAHGTGIRLAHKWSEIPKRKECVVSRYISRPFLIEKRKFDLRLYVVVTSFNPLRVYLHEEGIVRFATDEYAHLTNYSLNRKKRKPKQTSESNKDPRFDMSTNKWSLETLREYFSLKGLEYEQTFENIKDLIVRTIASGQALNSSGVRMFTQNRTCCYELFGFDVLLDKKLKPWLMEVNISPSLKTSCPVDEKIKSTLVLDLLNLIGVSVKHAEIAREYSLKKGRKQSLRSFHYRERMKPGQAKTEEVSSYDCLLSLTEDDITILKESEDEGKFERLFPTAESSSYLKLFSHPLHYDVLLSQWIRFNKIDPSQGIRILKELEIPAVQPFSIIPPGLKFAIKENLHGCKSAKSMSSLQTSGDNIANRNISNHCMLRISQPAQISHSSSQSTLYLPSNERRMAELTRVYSSSFLGKSNISTSSIFANTAKLDKNNADRSLSENPQLKKHLELNRSLQIPKTTIGDLSQISLNKPENLMRKDLKNMKKCARSTRKSNLNLSRPTDYPNINQVLALRKVLSPLLDTKTRARES
ncbi:Tubulin polyglutamylase ttll4 [Nowakowskiella sp. JEL0407]|nr:Tubulin polyglutamylase ttll4 [Nowakowskiella sp. JEL0407]